MAEVETGRRTAVVTGAAQGLGAEIACRLAGDGFAVALLDLSAEGLAQTRRRIENLANRVVVEHMRVDLSKEDQTAAAFSTIDAAFGRIDALINTAGGSGTVKAHEIEEVSAEVWHAVIGNNLTSAFLCCKHAVPIMRRNGYGRIVNFSSGVAGGLFGPSGTVGARLPYAASKAAIIGFTKQLAKDLARSGITVNAVSPGLVVPEEGRIRTIFDALADSDQAAIRAAIPAGRTGTARELAAAVSYLVSADAGFTSGAVLSVDGAAF